MKRIIHWLKNDLFYYHIITYYHGYQEKKLYINRTVGILTLVAVAMFGVWVILKASNII